MGHHFNGDPFFNFLKMKRYYFSLLLFVFLFFSCANDSDSIYESLPNLQERLLAGGETTVFLTSSNAFSTPAANLSGSKLDFHLDGDFQFETVFVTAPAPFNSGVGPIFNNSSCIGCHPKDGRSAFPTDINSLSGFFLRTSMPGVGNNNAPIPVPGFGDQIQNQAIYGFEPEAKFNVVYTPIVEILADGTQVTLQKPTYSLIDTYIDFPASAQLSPRLASPVFGLGLLEAIPEYYILNNEDINDADGDGISGKANYVFDNVSGEVKLGRFGWKANAASVMEQCAGAYVGDMGVTNPIFPFETGYGQTNGDDGLNDDAEISQALLDEITFYCQTLGVPAPRNLDDDSVMRGAALFDQAQCAKCHIPKMISGSFSVAEVANQTFYPYSDMLLHDMGDGLADNRPDFLADGKEWRTKPLWGIGLTKVVNGHTDFLHDGRAKNITEAILWHGGEAENAKTIFKNLSTSEREDLLKFINSL
jgi:CxxC motif-containing protein (DUF1111 family)